MLRDHGQNKKYHHDVIGWNARMDGLQGAVLSVKLKHLDGWNKRRRDNAALYSELLSESHHISTPVEKEHAKHVFHIYAIRVRNRDQLLEKLSLMGINAAIHYPIPIHLQAAYHHLSSKNGRLAVAEKCAGELVSLPMFPELSNEQIMYVTQAIKSH